MNEIIRYLQVLEGVWSIFAYGFVLVIFIYLSLSLIKREWLCIEIKPLIYQLTLYMLFGPTGEEVVNSMWRLVTGASLWEYRLYPLHGGDISVFFFQVWGIFGFYTYLRAKVFPMFEQGGRIAITLLLGFEAIFLELLVNIPYYAIFGDYIFYYFPENLGVFSHFSCLQVIPFYIMIGLTARRLVHIQEVSGYIHLKVTVGFYLMVLVAYILH